MVISMPKLQKIIKRLNEKEYISYNISIPKILVEVLDWKSGDNLKFSKLKQNETCFLVLEKKNLIKFFLALNKLKFT